MITKARRVANHLTSWPNVGAEQELPPRLKQWCSKLSLPVPGPPARLTIAERPQMPPVRRTDPDGEHPPRRRQLTERECRTWLSSHREGRLGYVTGRGPRAVVVNYAVTDEQIVLRLPDYSEITQYSLGEEVTLEVDGQEPSIGASEIVTVRGRAHRPDDPAIVSTVDLGESWPAGIRTNVMCVDLTTVQGTETAAS